MDYFLNAEHSRISLSFFLGFFSNSVDTHCKFYIGCICQSGTKAS